MTANVDYVVGHISTTSGLIQLLMNSTTALFVTPIILKVKSNFCTANGTAKTIREGRHHQEKVLDRAFCAAGSEDTSAMSASPVHTQLKVDPAGSFMENGNPGGRNQKGKTQRNSRIPG